MGYQAPSLIGGVLLHLDFFPLSSCAQKVEFSFSKRGIKKGDDLTVRAGAKKREAAFASWGVVNCFLNGAHS